MTAHLTSDDVEKQQFTNRRLRPAYDETEVDEFLDDVKAQLVEYEKQMTKLVGMCRRIAAGNHQDFPRNAKAARLARAVLAIADPKLALEPLPADEAVTW